MRTVLAGLLALLLAGCASSSRKPDACEAMGGVWVKGDFGIQCVRP